MCCMNTSYRYQVSSIISIINLPCLHGIKTRYEQQKEPNYLKNKPFSKSYNIFWKEYKELSIKLQKKP